MLRIFTLVLFMASVLPAGAQSDPLNFSAKFETDPAGEVSLKWTSAFGYCDILESSSDLLTWNPVTPPLLGFGQTFSVAVPDAAAEASGPGSGVIIPVYSANQRRYADGSLMLTWTADGVAWRKIFPASSAWAQLDWPGALDVTKSTPAPPTPLYRIIFIKWSAHPLAAPFPESTSLTPAAQEALDRILAAQPEAEAAIAAGPPEPGPQQSGIALTNGRSVFRVRRELRDSDDDLLNDCEELTWGFSDAYAADSDADSQLDTDEDFDGDGHANYNEQAYGTSQISGGSLPTNTPGLHVENSYFYPTLAWPVWKDLTRPYRYELVEKIGSGSWSEVNPYTHLLYQYTQAGPNSGMDLLTFRGDTPLFQGVTPFLDIRIRPRWPSYALRHPSAPVRRADWKAHNNAHIDSLIPNNEFGRNVFDEYNPNGPAKWAKWCWTNQMDYTGVSFNEGYNFPNSPDRYKATNTTGLYARWESAEEITMITPVHGIIAGHWSQRRLPGSLVVFHDSRGTNVVRHVSAIFPVPPPEPSPPNTPYDIAVIRLDAPVPAGVKVYKMFPVITSVGSPAEEFSGAKVIVISREMETFPYQISTSTSLSSLTFGSSVSAVSPLGTSAFYQFPARAPHFWQNGGEVGDSSGPCFAFYKGEQVLVGHNWYSLGSGPNGGIGISFYSSPSTRTQILNCLSQLGSDYSIQTVSLDP